MNLLYEVEKGGQAEDASGCAESGLIDFDFEIGNGVGGDGITA
jgi:hypothetical protein